MSSINTKQIDGIEPGPCAYVSHDEMLMPSLSTMSKEDRDRLYGCTQLTMRAKIEYVRGVIDVVVPDLKASSVTGSIRDKCLKTIQDLLEVWETHWMDLNLTVTKLLEAEKQIKELETENIGLRKYV
jgi:hypothetical protein